MENILSKCHNDFMSGIIIFLLLPGAFGLKCIQCYSPNTDSCLHNSVNYVECLNTTKSCMTGYVTDYISWYKRGGSRINDFILIRGRRRLLGIPVYRSVKRCYDEVNYKVKESCKSNRFKGYEVVICLCNSDLCNSYVLNSASKVSKWSMIHLLILLFFKHICLV